jgi:Lrp/AsnC family transcriptional regulator for asnA, asnC and gidA
MNEEIDIDDIDKKLLTHLQLNSKVSLTELSNELKLTRNAIKYRIKKLEINGYIIKYTTVINPNKFGKKVMAIFNFNVPLDKIKEFAYFLKKYDDITNVYFTTGSYSIYATGIFDNHDAVNRFLMDDLSKMPIRDFVVSTVLQRYKEQFFELK